MDMPTDSTDVNYQELPSRAELDKIIFSGIQCDDVALGQDDDGTVKAFVVTKNLKCDLDDLMFLDDVSIYNDPLTPFMLLSITDESKEKRVNIIVHLDNPEEVKYLITSLLSSYCICVIKDSQTLGVEASDYVEFQMDNAYELAQVLARTIDCELVTE